MNSLYDKVFQVSGAWLLG